MKNKIIVIGDLHLKNKQPYMKYQQKFLDWLLDEYSSDTDRIDMIFLGDIYDNSSPHWTIVDMFHQFLIERSNNSNNRSNIFILNGNHDTSRIKGCSLLPFNNIPNVIAIDDKIEINIKGLKCLFLPHKHNYKEYAELENKVDYIFSHVMTEKRQFANEGVSFENLHGCFIYGHDHMQGDFMDKNGNNHFILGVPYETRHLECQKHRILEINIQEGEFSSDVLNRVTSIKEIDVPQFFTHETIIYGEFPENKDNILNIIDAPSRKAVYEKYADYYIRPSGIKLLQTELTIEDHNKEFTHSSLLKRFNQFVKEFNVSKEVAELCSSKIISCIGE